MGIVGSIHWLLPWLILVVGIYTIIRFVRGYINEQAFTNTDSRLMSVFSGLLDLQATAGLVFFLWSRYEGILYPHSVSLHALVMFIAAVIPHFARYWESADNPTRYLNNFYLLLASFLLMLVGLSLVPM